MRCAPQPSPKIAEPWTGHQVYIDRLEEEEDKERVKPVLEGLIQKYKDEYGDDFAL